ncbi:ferrochelatase [Aestuariirhabdus sp. Z084]|uniref:ferrochelatase n=1 Tax=Aestuariirhabdus haliotis TaxID=2918751 RepID=UPI00201B4618|nr:ferrochelatase [Aestuariirhabdus haliotis]MCL6414098.1 ferrochelatase [Aestuariirhabdus haliotis]MCL6418030.1 ferrochelatase [Aestuariirhabdus haliotis]
MPFKGQSDYNHQGKGPRKGVLLTNLGTPDAPNRTALKRYLREFLSDPRVVEVPRLLWWLILNLIIVPIRSGASAKLYQEVWTDQGSPLMEISRRQASALQQRLDNQYGAGEVPVALGMRYGNPSISDAMQQLTEANVRELIVLPLYPQYCAATTGSTFDAVSAQLRQYRWVPSLHFNGGYHQHPAYIQAICQTISAHIDRHGVPERLILSYHGTPERYLKKGDPYYCFCQQTSRLVCEQLKLAEDCLLTTFQSRFGREPWLQPYTDHTLEALAKSGIRQVALLCPGFSSDCLETLEEIEMQNRELFIGAGGEQFHYIPCLNDAPEHISMMQTLVSPYLEQTSTEHSPAQVAAL